MRGGRADRVHEGEAHEDARFDARREIFHVDVAETGEDFLLALVARVEETEERPQFRISVLGQVEIPDAFVVGEKGEDGHATRDARFERGAGDGEGAALRAAECADPCGIVFGEGHDDACELHGIEEDTAEEKFVRRIVEAADEMSVVRVAFDRGVVLAASALPAAVERGDRQALAGVGQLVDPIAAVPGVAVELEDGRAGVGSVFGPDVFSVDFGPADAAEPQVEAFGLRGMDGVGRNQLRLGVRRLEFPERGGPVVVEIGGHRRDAAVNFQFLKGFVDQGHGSKVIVSGRTTGNALCDFSCHP